ncbi:MAG: 3'(2'),5'-bisphosphate nucleotidase CysQ [Parabacteroides sp.]|nr:3'(2'),5'-bisphosphate nucleotidase CysQ [Parabacteroides sp.]
MNEYLNYLYVAIRAAIDAGSAIMAIYDNPEEDIAVELKADNSPLTKADKQAHKIISIILSATPFPVLSEEGEIVPFAERSSWKTLWIVDPLDGTKEFIKRNGEFTVNIALVEGGIPVLGVIYIPVYKELYFATKSLGAYKLNGISGIIQPSVNDIIAKAIRLPNASAHQGIVVAVSRSYLNEETMAYIDDLRRQGQPVTLISSGSSMKICFVAEGSADIYPRFAPTMEWDTAAGHAIACAAGCQIYHTDEKTPLSYNKEDLHNPWFIVKSQKA